MLRDRGLDFHLTIAGPQERTGDAQKLQEAIDHYCLGECVEYVGTIGGADKDAALDRCDCLVLPSRAEGLPLTLLEAGAVGRAVIATDVGAVSDLVIDGETGLLLPPGDAESLGRAMITMAESPECRQKFGAALRRRIEQNYSLAHQSSLFEDIYHRLLESSRQKNRQERVAVAGGDCR